MVKNSFVLMLCSAVVVVVGCGGHSSTPPPAATPATILVTPSSTNVVIGGSQVFTANATGVTWSLTGPGSIDQNGIYRAPGTFPGNGSNVATITATAANGSGSTTATVVYPNHHQDFQSGPIKFGTSGGNVKDLTPSNVSPQGCCIGTLGALINRGGSLFILSNNHVLDRSSQGTAGEAIDQPGPPNTNVPFGCFVQASTVATLVSGQPAIKPTTADPNCTGSPAPICGFAPSNVDVGIAQVAAGQVDPTGSILDLGVAGPTNINDAPPTNTPVPASIGLPVAKSGERTGLTCSTIGSITTTIRVVYDTACNASAAFESEFRGQIVVNGTNFIDSGDSGSLLVTSANSDPVGLLYASGTSGAVANPLLDDVDDKGKPAPGVLSALNNGTPATIVGSPTGHQVSCAPTAKLASQEKGAGAASTITPQERHAAQSARDRHAILLMRDPAIKSVTAGVSADNPQEGAVVIEVSRRPKTRIPATLDGVRTRVVYEGTPPALTDSEVSDARSVKFAYEKKYMSQPGVQGIGVGRSDDNPAEPAIVIYTITGVPHDPIPPVIGGVRTKVVDGTRFIAR